MSPGPMTSTQQPVPVKGSSPPDLPPETGARWGGVLMLAVAGVMRVVKAVKGR